MYLRRGDSTDVSYAQVGMDIICLSDSFNWVRQGRYLVVRQSQLGVMRTSFASTAYSYTWWQPWWIHCELESDKSQLGTRPGILASTYKAFDFWPCNPRVSGRSGSGPGRPSDEPRECTRITAMEEARSEGGSTSYIQILRATAIDDLLASEVVIWSFSLRVGVRIGLLGVTVESIASGEIGTRH